MVCCDSCGVDVSNIGKHIRRGRCVFQHIRKAERIAQRMKIR